MVLKLNFPKPSKALLLPSSVISRKQALIPISENPKQNPDPLLKPYTLCPGCYSQYGLPLGVPSQEQADLTSLASRCHLRQLFALHLHSDLIIQTVAQLLPLQDIKQAWQLFLRP